MKRLLGTGLLLSVALAVSGCVHGDWDGNAVKDRVEESRPLAQNGRFSLDNTNGRVEVMGWDEPRVAIEAVKHARSERMLDELKIEILAEDDRVEVRTRYPKRMSMFGGQGRVDYVVKVPRGARVEVENVNGRLEVRGIDARVEAETVNGTVSVEGVVGEVRASSVNGAVEASIARVDPEGSYRLHTTNGSVRLSLPGGSNAEIDAGTVNGSIDSDFDVDGRKTRRKLEGRIGSGGGRFDLGTVNGSIHIERGAEARAEARPQPEATPQAESR